MESITAIKHYIMHKKECFINEYYYYPTCIIIDIDIYRKLIDLLNIKKITVKEFEDSIGLTIKTTRNNTIVLN